MNTNNDDLDDLDDLDDWETSVIENSTKEHISDDEWDNDNFEPHVQTLTQHLHITDISIESKNKTDLKLETHTKPINKPVQTIDEVEIKYPNGNTSKEKSIGKSSTNYTHDDIEKIYKAQTDTNRDDLIKELTCIIKPKQTKTIQGSSKIILKTVLINTIINTIDYFIKQSEFIKFSQNLSSSSFHNEILGHITKKDKFKYNDTVFNIKKTLHKLNEINQYLFTKRKSTDKLSIITKQNYKCDDLIYILYKIILYILYNSIRNNHSNTLLDTYDIFEMLSFIKLLKMKDDVTLHYIKHNY